MDKKSIDRWTEHHSTDLHCGNDMFPETQSCDENSYVNHLEPKPFMYQLHLALAQWVTPLTFKESEIIDRKSLWTKASAK